MTKRLAEVNESIASLCEVNEELESQISGLDSEFRAEREENKRHIQSLLNEVESLKRALDEMSEFEKIWQLQAARLDARVSGVESTQLEQSSRLDRHQKDIEDMGAKMVDLERKVEEQRETKQICPSPLSSTPQLHINIQNSPIYLSKFVYLLSQQHAKY